MLNASTLLIFHIISIDLSGILLLVSCICHIVYETISSTSLAEDIYTSVASPTAAAADAAKPACSVFGGSRGDWQHDFARGSRSFTGLGSGRWLSIAILPRPAAVRIFAGPAGHAADGT